MEHQGPPAFSLAGTEPPQVLLALGVSGPHNGQHLPAGGSIPLLVAALQLHGYEVASKGAIEYSQPRWVQPFAYPVPITLPQLSRSPHLFPSPIQRGKRLAGLARDSKSRHLGPQHRACDNGWPSSGYLGWSGSRKRSR